MDSVWLVVITLLLNSRKVFYCNDSRITELNINDTHNSSTAYILLYILIVGCLWQNCGGWQLIASHGAGACVCPLNTGREIGAEIYWFDNIFPTDDPWFGSEIDTVVLNWITPGNPFAHPGIKRLPCAQQRLPSGTPMVFTGICHKNVHFSGFGRYTCI